MLLPLACAVLTSQSPAVATERPPAVGEPIAIALRPAGDDSAVALRWSPKGAKVPLVPDGDALTGEYQLGPAGVPPVRVRLERSDGSEHFDVLLVDRNRDGRLSIDERLTTKPRLTRNKWWSNFSTIVEIPVQATKDAGASDASRPYPMALWYVVDPREEQQEPVLRWTRRGWHEGRCEIAGEPAFVLVTESAMDGLFSRQDAWMLARRPEDLGLRSRSMSSHSWLDGIAFRVVALDPHGRSITIEAFDPGFTEAEEKERQDTTKPDREAPRAAEPLAFGHDLAAALAEAKRTGRKVFVDFETTWCGPCKAMDQVVYTSKAVVEAAQAAKLLCVKLDGDEQRDLVKKYEVEGYPTMLLLDEEGKVVARAVGYRSVKAMVTFLSK